MQNKNDDFTYDPEAEENSKGTRLPFGLCKSYGIKIEDWWTPRDAWQALQDGGYVGDVSEEYCPFCKKLFDIAEAIGYDGSNPDTAICPDCGGLLEAIYNDENPGC